MKLFERINIEISNICNLQCSFCPEVIRPKKIMATDDFKKVLSQVKGHTRQVTLHLMGDPLVHPDLRGILEACSDAHLPVFFVTNGVLLREEKVELLLHPILRQVNFSLHSYPDNFPDRDPLPYLQKILNYTDLALKQRPDLYLNFRLWNLDPGVPTPDHPKKKNREILDAILEHYQVQDFWDTTIDVRMKKNFKLSGRLFLHFDTEFIWPSLDLPVLGESGYCLGLKSHVGILSDGTVVPCCLDKEGVIPLGNVFNTSFVDILKDERAQKMRVGFQNRVFVEDLCKRCHYIQRFSN